MAAELKKARGIDATLVQSSGGVFEVEYNGRLIFSKKMLGRFPDDGEVLQLIGQESMHPPSSSSVKH